MPSSAMLVTELTSRDSKSADNRLSPKSKSCLGALSMGFTFPHRTQSITEKELTCPQVRHVHGFACTLGSERPAFFCSPSPLAVTRAVLAAIFISTVSGRLNVDCSGKEEEDDDEEGETVSANIEKGRSLHQSRRSESMASTVAG